MRNHTPSAMLLYQLIDQVATMKQQPKVLILGGTNFMGKALLDALALTEPTPVVVCINRGKVYWNNEARKQHPEVQNFYCDRKEHNDTTATLSFVSKHLKIDSNNKWTCVIDFSAFRWRDVQSVTKAIAGIAHRYIFISTDSIYNNSTRKISNPIREDDFAMEEEYRAIKASTRSKDTYGYNKLKCQLYLHRVKPLPFVCLRLPDVIGPYDNTERFWCTARWLKQSARYPVPITADEETIKLSFVDSLSVAAEITKLITMDEVPSQTYNLCSRESVTLKEFIDLMATAISPGFNPNFKAQRNKNSNHFYPSVECGSISCERATKQIAWEPLPLADAIKQSVDFFLNKASDYAEERKQMEKEFKRKIVEKSD